MTLRELYIYGKKNLQEECESLILLEEFYNKTRQDIIMTPDLEIKDYEKFYSAVEKRKQNQPLQYIIGHWDFDSLRLRVKDGVLIPREDSLSLVFTVAETLKSNVCKGLDLCSGTGAIALSLIKNCPNITVDAIELFDIPFECLVENIKNHGQSRVRAIKADIFTEYEKYSELDFIVSNPPYIARKEIATLQKEVQNEPVTALDGGIDGLDFYRVICEKWYKCLKKSGILAVEIGDTQAKEVSKLFKDNNFKNIKVINDLNSLPRVVYGEKM